MQHKVAMTSHRTDLLKAASVYFGMQIYATFQGRGKEKEGEREGGREVEYFYIDVTDRPSTLYIIAITKKIVNVMSTICCISRKW